MKDMPLSRPVRRSATRRRSPSVRLSWQGAVAFGMVVLALAAASGVVGLYVLRRLPSRYVVTYLPEPLQALVSRPHVDLPTPAATLPAGQLAALLAPVLTPTDMPVNLSTPLAVVSFQTVAPLTPTPAFSPTLSALPSPTSAPTPTLTLTPAYAPGPTQLARSTPATLADTTVLLTGFRHTYQGWNNCAPATLAIALSYFGWGGTQNDTAAVLKPDPEDRNVSPHELAAYARSQGYQVLVRTGGTLDTLKALLHAGLPVIIERGFEPDEKLGWMGHYLLIIGYNQSRQEFVAMDSYLGPMQSAPFDEMDRYWQQFNRLYVVIYTADQALMVSQLIGASFDDGVMLQNAMAAAQAEVAQQPEDAFGWFNIGSNYQAMGLSAEAVTAYDRARELGLPWRMTWYQFGWFEAYLAVERYDDVLALAEATLKPNQYSEEMYYYKGRVYAARGEVEQAREQYGLALEHNPNFVAAQQALQAITP